MPDELPITVPGSDSLPAATRQELIMRLTRHGEAIMEEASRIEDRRHSGSGPPEITSSDVADGDLAIRRGFVSRRPPRRVFWGSFGAYIAAFVSGAFTNNLDEPVFALGFGVALALGVTAHFWGRERDGAA